MHLGNLREEIKPLQLGSAKIGQFHAAPGIQGVRQFGGLGLALAFVGFSRVYLGALWLGDVLGGYVPGAGIVAAVVLGWRLWKDGVTVPSRGLQRPPAKFPLIAEC